MAYQVQSDVMFQGGRYIYKAPEKSRPSIVIELPCDRFFGRNHYVMVKYRHGGNKLGFRNLPV